MLVSILQWRAEIRIFNAKLAKFMSSKSKQILYYLLHVFIIFVMCG